jgi:hypothetical protein
MDENLKMISYMIQKNPLVVVGLLLVGLSGLMLTRIQLTMLKSGYKFPYLKYLTKRNWEIPQDYLKQRAKHGWSPWVAYLIWPVAFIGVVCLVIGLFRLQ